MLFAILGLVDQFPDGFGEGQRVVGFLEEIGALVQDGILE
jgi:hypothetical protein